MLCSRPLGRHFRHTHSVWHPLQVSLAKSSTPDRRMAWASSGSAQRNQPACVAV